MVTHLELLVYHKSQNMGANSLSKLLRLKANHSVLYVEVVVVLDHLLKYGLLQGVQSLLLRLFIVPFCVNSLEGFVTSDKPNLLKYCVKPSNHRTPTTSVSAGIFSTALIFCGYTHKPSLVATWLINGTLFSLNWG